MLSKGELASLLTAALAEFMYRGLCAIANRRSIKQTMEPCIQNTFHIEVVVFPLVCY